MANAAAKKAAAARGAAANTYFPIIAGVNLFYLFLRIIYCKTSLTVFHGSMSLILVGLSCFAYKGILEDHAHSAGSGAVGKGEALAGGLSLDLLGLTVLVQFGSLASDYFYFLLALIPIAGGYKLYKTFKGDSAASAGFMNESNEVESTNNNKFIDPDKADARKQKRAERRRQKWN
ncbi:hypothetical protein HJC23_008745 [Cyclotella cryptica]|uniref:Transmembrane protein 208 n=1 Tax=Cyclotella cryptica TaxID=29204 RepID=A0ABD3PDG2_9STRA|eukprot:CCRYP_015659-RA/>CCRYP_015659-RA protein AED:0.47 eAED:0.47 QI:0/0/0/1/1/1/2/0/175